MSEVLSPFYLTSTVELKLFDYYKLVSPARLAIIKVLYVGERLQFSIISRMMRLSDGALGHHLKELEDSGLVHAIRSFNRRQPTVHYQLTETGRETFRNFLGVLREYIDECRVGAPVDGAHKEAVFETDYLHAESNNRPKRLVYPLEAAANLSR